MSTTNKVNGNTWNPECEIRNVSVQQSISRTKAGPQQAQRDARDTEKCAAVAHDEQYTVFTPVQRAYIAILVSLAAFFSPLSANIYFPAIPVLSQDLHVSTELLNLTVTVYLIVQGFVPSITGDMADMVGRRPVYTLVLTIYLGANVGLALQASYLALMMLRIVQSVGVSGCIALAVSVMADVAPPHSRGKYVGLALAGPNSATSLGPIIGGALAGTIGWRWIFWLLTIMSAVCLLLVTFLLPETGRQIVGNGGISPPKLNRLPVPCISPSWTRDTARHGLSIARPPLRIPNPFPCLRVIGHKDTIFVLLANAIFYMTYCCQQASLSTLMTSIYGLNPVQVGLCYMAYGFGSAIASYLTGKLIDFDYKAVAKQIGHTIDKVRGDDLTKFPIERARLRSIFHIVIISATSTLAFGWTLQARTHIAVPLIFQFICGVAITGTFNICNTLVVDVHPECPSTASAAVSMIRCLLAAAGVSIMELLFDAIDVGWTFTILSILCFCTVPMLLFTRKHSERWRHQRLQAQRTKTRIDDPQSTGEVEDSKRQMES